MAFSALQSNEPWIIDNRVQQQGKAQAALEEISHRVLQYIKDSNQHRTSIQIEDRTQHREKGKKNRNIYILFINTKSKVNFHNLKHILNISNKLIIFIELLFILYL